MLLNVRGWGGILKRPGPYAGCHSKEEEEEEEEEEEGEEGGGEGGGGGERGGEEEEDISKEAFCKFMYCIMTYSPVET